MYSYYSNIISITYYLVYWSFPLQYWNVLLLSRFMTVRNVHTLLLLVFGSPKHTILTQVGHKNVQQLFLLLRHVAVSDIHKLRFFCIPILLPMWKNVLIKCIIKIYKFIIRHLSDLGLIKCIYCIRMENDA